MPRLTTLTFFKGERARAEAVPSDLPDGTMAFLVSIATTVPISLCSEKNWSGKYLMIIVQAEKDKLNAIRQHTIHDCVFMTILLSDSLDHACS